MTGPGGDEVGRVSVRVVPDVSGFDDEVRRELDKIKDVKIKVQLDEDDLRRQIEEIDDITIKVKFDVENVRDDVQRATQGLRADPIDVPLDVDRDALGRAVADAADSVDPIDLPVQLNQAQIESSIREVETQLRDLSNETASPEAILRTTELQQQLRDLKADLARLDAQEIDVRVFMNGDVEVRRPLNIDPIEVPLEVDAALFSAELQRAIDAGEVIAGDPILFQLDLDQREFERKIAQTEAEIRKLRSQGVDIALNARAESLNAAIAESEAKLAALTEKDWTAEVQVKIDEERGRVNELVGQLALLDRTVVEPEVRLQIENALAKLVSYAAELNAIDGKRIKTIAEMDVDTIGADARIAAFVARQRARNKITLDLDIDRGRLDIFESGFIKDLADLPTMITSGIGTALRTVGGFLGNLGEGFSQSAAQAGKLLGFVGQVGAQLAVAVGIGSALAVAGAAVTAAWAAVATAISAVPAAIFLLGAPIGAVMLGLNGIKKAAASLKPEFDQLKTAVSATFEKGLLPVFDRLRTLFPTVQTGMVGIADSLVKMASSMTLFLTSERGVTLIAGALQNVKQALLEMTPGLRDLVDGILNLANNKAAFDALTGAVNTFGRAFNESVIKLTNNGTMTAAFQELQGLLESLSRAFVGLTENGIRTFVGAGPGMRSFLNDLTGFFGRFNWETLGRAVGGVFEGLGAALRGIPDGTLRDIEDGFTKLGEAFKDPAVQQSIKDIAGAIGPLARQLGGLIGPAAQAAAEIANLIKKFDEWDQKFREFSKMFSETDTNLSENGEGILTSRAKWWNDLMDIYDRGIERFKQWHKDNSLNEPLAGSTDAKSPFGDLFDFDFGDLPELPSFGDDEIGAPGFSTDWFDLDEQVKGFIEDMSFAATGALVNLATVVTNGLNLVRAAFNLTGIGESFGLVFQRMVGTANLGMAAIAATITTGMIGVNAAFDFTGVGISLEQAFTTLVAATAAGMARIGTAVDIGMLGVIAAFDFSTVGLSIGTAFQSLVLAVSLGMVRLADTVTIGMIGVNAAFDFTNTGLTIGLAFQGIVGTVTLGMQSIAVAVTTGMALVNAAFNWENVKLTIGLAFLGIVGTVTLGMQSIANAVLAGMPSIIAAFSFVTVAAAIAAAFAAIVAVAAGGMAGISAAILGAMSGILGFWRSNWNLLPGIVQSAGGLVVAAARGFMSLLTAAVRDANAQVVSAVRDANNQMATAWRTGMATVQSVVRSGLQGAVAAARGFVGQFNGVGRALMQGLQAGIMAMIGPIATAAANVVRAALAAARAAGIVKSPSRAMMEIGNQLGAGLAIGMDQSKGRVTAAAGSMISAVAGVADQMTSTFSDATWADDFGAKVETSLGDMTVDTANRDVVGQLRALRGDVGMTPGDAAIVAQLKVLIAVLGARNGATGEAQAHRTASVLGAF